MLSLLLPNGYHIERDADVLTLLRSDGTVVARFSAGGVVCEEVMHAVTEDAAKALVGRLRRAPVRHAYKAVPPTVID